MKSFWLPVSVLCLIVGSSLLNGAAIGRYTDTWITQVELAEDAVSQGRWDEAESALRTVYDDWNGKQTYLHIVGVHGELDAAETSFLRSLACIKTQDETEFRIELQELLGQFRLLAEMEQLSVKNIL